MTSASNRTNVLAGVRGWRRVPLSFGRFLLLTDRTLRRDRAFRDTRGRTRSRQSWQRGSPQVREGSFRLIWISVTIPVAGSVKTRMEEATKGGRVGNGDGRSEYIRTRTRR